MFGLEKSIGKKLNFEIKDAERYGDFINLYVELDNPTHIGDKRLKLTYKVMLEKNEWIVKQIIGKLAGQNISTSRNDKLPPEFVAKIDEIIAKKKNL